LFTYVQNDPIDKLDPSGHQAPDDQHQQQLQQEQAKQVAAVAAQQASSRPSVLGLAKQALEVDKRVAWDLLHGRPDRIAHDVQDVIAPPRPAAPHQPPPQQAPQQPASKPQHSNPTGAGQANA